MSNPETTQSSTTNREVEMRWRRGEITFAALDWWLRWISGV